MRLRTWYLGINNEPQSHDWETSHGDLDAQLDSLGNTVSKGALVVCNDDSGFSFAFPASRLLFIERLPWS